jgi:hypothetical protein
MLGAALFRAIGVLWEHLTYIYLHRHTHTYIHTHMRARTHTHTHKNLQIIHCQKICYYFSVFFLIMYYNVSSCAPIPFTGLTTKQWKGNMKNNLIYSIRPFNVILRLVQFMSSEILSFVGVFWCAARTVCNGLEGLFLNLYFLGRSLEFTKPASTNHLTAWVEYMRNCL